MSREMTIGEVARHIGLPAKTIRYYEEIRLIHPKRDMNGYRIFDEADAHTLAFLGRARDLGVSIDDCRKLLALYNDKSRASVDVKTLAKGHLREIENKIDQLEEMRKTLSDLVRACSGADRPDCPILTDLAKR